MQKDERPLCPKCGCPARHVRGRALVMITLNLDNSLGKVERVSSRMELPVREYACGIDHRWTVEGAVSRLENE